MAVMARDTTVGHHLVGNGYPNEGTSGLLFCLAEDLLRILIEERPRIPLKIIQLARSTVGKRILAIE